MIRVGYPTCVSHLSPCTYVSYVYIKVWSRFYSTPGTSVCTYKCMYIQVYVHTGNLLDWTVVFMNSKYNTACTCIHACMHTCIHAYKNTVTHAEDAGRKIYKYMYICMYVNTHIRIHTFKHTHTHTCTQVTRAHNHEHQGNMRICIHTYIRIYC